MDRRKHISESLKKFIKELSKDFNIQKIIFFGSRTTNKFREDSDIDLIIVSDNFKNMDFFERTARMYDYWSLDLPVDFLCYTPREFEKLRKKVSIVREALSQGIVIR